MASPYHQGSESINQSEHVGPNKTGDNIPAKRAANYVWNADSSSWERQTNHGSSPSDPTYTQEAGPAPLDSGNSTQTPLQPGSFTNFTVDDSTDIFTSSSHGLDDGDVIVVTTDDTLPDGMEESQIYYVSDKTTNTFKLKTANNILATYLDVTDTGTGTHSWAEPAKYTGTWTQIHRATDLFMFAFTAGSAFGGFEVQWSSDGVTQNTDALNISNIKTTENDDTAGFWIYLDTLTTDIDNYYRVVAYAGSDTMTLADLRTWTYPDGFHGTFLGLDDTLSDLSTALLTRAVQAGESPDGSFVNTPADGVVYSNDTPLGSAGNLSGDIFDTRGHKALKLSVTTDQVSATDGVQIRWYSDLAGTNEILPATKRTFTSDDVTSGGALYALIPRARYAQLDYTNGGTGQGSFYAEITLHNSATVNPIGEIGGSVNLTSLAVMGINHLMAANDSDVIDLIRRGSSGGLRTSINQHEVDTPIKALTNASNAGVTVLSSATRIDTSQLSGRKAVSLKATTTNNKRIFIGFANTVTTSNGYPLSAGSSVEMDLSTAKELWGIADGSSQSLFMIQLA